MDNLDKANLISLVVILSVNLLVGFSFEKQQNLPPDKRSSIRIAHIFWTATWLLWLLSWFVLIKGAEESSVLLNDLGSFCLVAFAITFISGTTILKKYALPLVSFFVLDGIYLLTMDLLVHQHDIHETEIPQGVTDAWISDVIHHHTVLFGPSLCVTILAIGFVAWALIHASQHFDLDVAVGFIGVVYALAQIYVYQSGLFIPFLHLSSGAKFFLLGWRILFVTGYWLVMLMTAGVAVAGARVWAAVSSVIGVISTIVGLVGNLKKAH